MKKSDLPTKLCCACQQPFAWRKKWARCWDEVRFCSDRCRGQRRLANAQGAVGKGRAGAA
ncbi:DUF2256 domain-containing protein [Rhizobium taibaishanense]